MNNETLLELAKRVNNSVMELRLTELRREDPRPAESVFGTALKELVEFARFALEENVAMRAFTGPRCPRCKHFLRAEHHAIYEKKGTLQTAHLVELICDYEDERWPQSRQCRCRWSPEELRGDYPELAAEMNL